MVPRREPLNGTHSTRVAPDPGEPQRGAPSPGEELALRPGSDLIRIPAALRPTGRRGMPHAEGPHREEQTDGFDAEQDVADCCRPVHLREPRRSGPGDAR